MKGRRLVFTAPGSVEVQENELRAPSPNEVLIRTLVSGISSGTELLFFRGEVPEGVALDETIDGLAEGFRYPVSYGYASVGKVVEAGAGVSSWRGRRVFAFAPHASYHLMDPSLGALEEIPEGVSNERAALFPTMETALNVALDARPLAGERVLVVGQGVVGLATVAVFSRFPLAALWSVEPLPGRRAQSLRFGAGRSLSPEELREVAGEAKDFDLTVELSGSPSALDTAIANTGFEGRVVVGSWYGTKRAAVDLGTDFHRKRLRIRSSQVSHLCPGLSGRWSRKRRLAFAWKLLEELPVEELVTHRVPLARACEGYRLLDEAREDALQVLLVYE